MNKPIPVTNITIQLPDNNNMTQQEQQKVAQLMMADIMKKSAQEQRDWEIYQRGVSAGSSGILGIFGL